MPPRICPHCGTRNFTDNPKCSRCGKPLGKAAATPPAPIPPISSSKPISPSRGTSWPSAATSITPPAAPATPSRAPTSSAIFYPSLIHLGLPQLEGKVIDVSQIQVVAERKPGVIRGFVTTLLFFIRPMIVVGAWILGGRRPTEYRSVHLIRVKQRDGTIRQARIEHDMLGASMDPGDDVSIWGYVKHGVIVVQRAYNHTVDAEVRLKGVDNPIKAWLLIFAGVILFLFFLGSREW